MSSKAVFSRPHWSERLETSSWVTERTQQTLNSLTPVLKRDKGRRPKQSFSPNPLPTCLKGDQHTNLPRSLLKLTDQHGEPNCAGEKPLKFISKRNILWNTLNQRGGNQTRKHGWAKLSNWFCRFCQRSASKYTSAHLLLPNKFSLKISQNHPTLWSHALLWLHCTVPSWHRFGCIPVTAEKKLNIQDPFNTRKH